MKLVRVDDPKQVNFKYFILQFFLDFAGIKEQVEDLYEMGASNAWIDLHSATDIQCQARV